MSKTMAPRGLDPQLQQEVGRDDSGGIGKAGNDPSIWHWLRHLVEMSVAMMIGMCVGVGIFAAILGVSYHQLVLQDPTAALIVMAVAMTVPMVAWMRIRRHTWRHSMEMGAAMLLPAIPFLGCLWAHVFSKAPNGPYMAVSIVAMLGLMLYRWDVYATHPAKPLPVSSS